MPIMYCRYIDDCCVITSTQQEMDVLFDILNRQSQHIRFTREVPQIKISDKPKLNELGHVLNVESGNLHENFALSHTIGNTNCDRVKAAMESIRNDSDFIESHSVTCG
nr:unnamed protein product [Haemonchus contortus]